MLMREKKVIDFEDRPMEIIQLKKQIKYYEKKYQRLGTCGTGSITKKLSFILLESQKEERDWFSKNFK